MRKYPEENWRHLGRWIHDARIQGGTVDMNEWAERVGRSTRQLRGLERGESVGPKTIEAVANALGIEPWYLFAILVNPETVPNGTSLTDADVRAMRSQFEAETGLSASTRDPDSSEPGAPRWIAEMFTEARTLSGATVEALASRAGMTPTQWREIIELLELGGTAPVDPVARMALALGISSVTFDVAGLDHIAESMRRQGAEAAAETEAVPHWVSQGGSEVDVKRLNLDELAEYWAVVDFEASRAGREYARRRGMPFASARDELYRYLRDGGLPSDDHPESDRTDES